MTSYRGRFAPSPTGALHAGSLVAALASWLDAKAHGGNWLVRIEDVDAPRCMAGADQEILRQLAACGLLPDEPPVYQSQRSALYQAALDQLVAQQAAYPCGCSRQDIEAALAQQGLNKQRHGELIYPHTCRNGLHGKPARAWRFNLTSHPAGFESNPPQVQANKSNFAISSVVISSSTDAATVTWHDRRLGPQQQDVAREVGDFVLKRADSWWAYQLAVVADDAAQSITHVVRGEDLADNTARQILLQRALGYPTPQYLHTPLVLAADGQKLSKQNGAKAMALQNQAQAMTALSQAAIHLGLNTNSANTLSQVLQELLLQWKLQTV